ncbi:ABC transporter ATP-binding protein [Dongshaea marina]|uniref:ABC transporter ATP-binding protein n=1 Tax=Dongshaea marina TaxID=2047966 RepID=UPI000D3E7365|nr:ABC transporter ATP-binding protein [Dongshaea marina]
MSTQDWVIDVSGITKSFDGRRVVNDVALKVQRGDVYGFLGPNGSGKTTTIRMLCGLMTPDAGQGSCLGYDVLEQSEEIKCRVGYMTQKFSLYEDLSIEENLDFIGRLFDVDRRKQRVAGAIERLGIGRRRKKQLAGNLSGGWKQRLALAAATIHEPELLLLDEPTAGVDPTARRDFWDEIHRLSDQGITTLVSTHYMDEAEQCNKLAYIAYGNMLVNGSVREVIDKAGIETLEVTGEGLRELSTRLQQIPQVLQVATFGQKLHVSANRGSGLLQRLQAVAGDGFTLRSIPPGLEDVFMHLMQTQEDNFS